MVNLSQMTAAPSELKLGDKTYTIRPLRDVDYGRLEAWVQDRHIEITKRNLEGLSESAQEKLLEKAFERASRLTLTSPEALGLMTSIEGSIKMLHLAVSQDHPEVTTEELFRAMGDPANSDEITRNVKKAMQALETMERRAAPAAPKEPFRPGKAKRRKRR